jgi:hypothetical protein
MPTCLGQKQLFVTGRQVLSFPFDLSEHFGKFSLDNGSVGIGYSSVESKEGSLCFLESVLGGEPSRRVRE